MVSALTVLAVLVVRVKSLLLNDWPVPPPSAADCFCADRRRLVGLLTD